MVEPSQLAAPDFSPRHWTFIQQSLEALRLGLGRLGQPLLVRTGEVLEVLEGLRLEADIGAV